MNNWHLLLLALVAILQPIASFSERNVFDGRQCCDRQLQSFSRASNRLIDDSFHLGKASIEERRLNRNAIRHIKKHFETTLDRRSTERIRRQIVNSATQLRIQEKINTDNERLGYHKRNYRSTRQELDFQRVRIENNERNRNTRDVRNANEITRTLKLKIAGNIYKREGNGMNRRESKERNVRRNPRHLMSSDRRTFLDETRELNTIRRKMLPINRRSRENVIESRRSASLPNMRINNIRDIRNSGHRLLRVIFKQRQITIQDVKHRGQQPTENRVSIRRSSRDRILIRSVQRYSSMPRIRNNRTKRNSMIQNDEVNMYRHNIIQKRIETRQATRRAVSRRMERELIKTELSYKTRYNVRRDFRDVRPTRSTESRRDMSRMQVKYEIGRESTMERDNVDLRNLKAAARVREHVIGHQNQEQFKNQTNENWSKILFTLQGIYLCGIFMQMINGDGCKKLKSRNLRWWTPTSASFIKVE